MFRTSITVMRGVDHQQGDMFSYLSPEGRVRKDHPLRAIRAMAEQALEQMSPLFDALCWPTEISFPRPEPQPYFPRLTPLA